MSFLAAPLAIGGGILQGMASITQGNMAAEAGKARENELKIDAQNTEIAAKQSQAARLDELTRTTGNINAIVASRGLDLNSPSALAMTEGARDYTYRDIGRERFNAMQTASNQRVAGAQARLSGKMAQRAGYLSAAGSFFKAGTTAASVYG